MLLFLVAEAGGSCVQVQLGQLSETRFKIKKKESKKPQRGREAYRRSPL
jgi:hypothetical protein